MRRREAITLKLSGPKSGPRAVYVSEPGNAPVIQADELRAMIGLADDEKNPKRLELHVDTQRPVPLDSDYVEIYGAGYGYRWRDVSEIRWSAVYSFHPALYVAASRLLTDPTERRFFLWVEYDG